MANGRPGAIEAIMPVPVSRCAGRNIRLRAAKWVFAPQSSEITASSAIRSLTALMTICGRRGDTRRRFDLGKQAVPVRHAALRLLKETTV